MAATYTGQLGQLLFRQYGELANPVAPSDMIASDIDFIQNDKRNGELYVFPLRFGLENGATFNNDHTAYALGSASAAAYQQAQLRGSEMTIVADIAYADMTSLSPNRGRSSRGYDQGVGLKIVNTSDSAVQKRDMMLLYGPNDNGAVTIGVVAAVGAYVAANPVQISITAASYIPGFWQEAIGVKVELFSTTAGATPRVTAPAFATVTAVDRDNALVTLTPSTVWASSPTAGDVIYFFGSRAVSMAGLQCIAENAGTLFNVSAVTYPQWKAVQYAVGGTALTFDAVTEGLSAVADNGLSDGATLYVNPRTWNDLMTDQAALRRRIEDESTAKAGYSKLKFEMQCGIVEIKAHKYVKQSLAFAIPTQECHRIGSTDITFTAPGSPNKYFWLELPSNNGAQIRCYSDQAVVSENPSHICLFTGIVSTAQVNPGTPA